MKNKSEIRTYIKNLKKQLSTEEVNARSEKIAKNFFLQPFYKDAKNIYLYVSYNQEVNTKIIISQMLKDKKRVAVPKIVDGDMVFHEITSLQQLSVGAFGILEPNVVSPVEKNPLWNEHTIMVLPGLAFDKNGGRVGYGGGYYDRYLEKNRERITMKIALAYDFQVFEHIEVESFDEKIDTIITENYEVQV